MLWLLPGVLSFAFFLLFDIRKAAGARHAGLMFLTGGILLFASTAGLLLALPAAALSAWRIVCGVLSLMSLFGMLHLLFGALPAKATYQSGSGKLALHSAGAYALCRHPAFWCFLLFYWLLYLFAESPELFAAAVLFPVLNLAYVWVQDRCLFPKYIEGYRQYRDEVPFLLPNGRSINKFRGSR